MVCGNGRALFTSGRRSLASLRGNSDNRHWCPLLQPGSICGRASTGQYLPHDVLEEKGIAVANFTQEQALAVSSVQQLINDWAYELDVNNGLQISGLVTEDCTYIVGGATREGRANVEKFYQERMVRLSAQPGSVPTQRHTLSNLRVSFRSATDMSITFTLVYFTTAGMKSGLNHADPAAVADVRMNCRRDKDGEWRISMFDSNQTFKRVPT